MATHARDLKVWGVVALSAPTFVYAGYDTVFRVFLPAFLTDTIGLGAATGLVLVVARFWDILVDSIIGALSDVRIGSFGRRRVWIALGTPVALVALWLVSSAQPGTSAPVMATWLCLLVTGWSMINAAHGAWALEAASGLKGRSRVFAGRTIAGLAGMISLTGVVAIVSARNGMPDGPMPLLTAILTVGAPLTAAFLFWRVPDAAPAARALTLSAFRRSFALEFTNARRARLALLFALVGASAAVSGGSFIYLVRGGVGLPDWSFTALFAMSVATAVGLIIGLWINQRFGPYRTLTIAFATDLLAAGALLFLPAHDPLALLCWASLRGLFAGVDFMLLRALAGEELDAETSASGVSEAGVVYSTFHLPFNLAGALATALLFEAYRWAGIDLKGVGEGPEPALAVIPAIGGVLLSSLSLFVVRLQAAGDSKKTAQAY